MYLWVTLCIRFVTSVATGKKGKGQSIFKLILTRQCHLYNQKDGKFKLIVVFPDTYIFGKFWTEKWETPASVQLLKIVIVIAVSKPQISLSSYGCRSRHHRKGKTSYQSWVEITQCSPLKVILTVPRLWDIFTLVAAVVLFCWISAPLRASTKKRTFSRNKIQRKISILRGQVQ